MTYWALGTGLDRSVFYDAAINNGGAVMQYTGLKDKNGKEIYEGDILKYVVPADGEITDQDVEYVEEVIFDDGIFCVDGYVPVSCFNDEAEVIGNIHENPELL